MAHSPVAERLRIIISGDRAELLAHAETHVPPVAPESPVRAVRRLVSLRRRLAKLRTQLGALPDDPPEAAPAPGRAARRRARLSQNWAALRREAEFQTACIRRWLDS